jgi:two-component system sensor histidine kinase PilS (NtrC family)
MDELKTKLHWVIALRVVTVTLLLGLSLAFQIAKGERVATFYGLILFTYLATILYTALLRHLQDGQALTLFAWSQVSIDLILETILSRRPAESKARFRCCMSLRWPSPVSSCGAEPGW